MKVENDYIKKEIEKINLLLTSLIEKISGIKFSHEQNYIKEIDKNLNNIFDFTFEDFIKMEPNEAIKNITTLQETNIEKFSELLFELVINSNLSNSDKIKIAKKCILLIDILDSKTKIFSIERMNRKNKLLQIAEVKNQ